MTRDTLVVIRKTLQRYDEQIVFCKFFRKKMQKKMHFSYFLATRARLIHFSTFPRIAVPWFLAHNNYIIYNIIILLWGFYQPTQMCGNVKLWIFHLIPTSFYLFPINFTFFLHISPQIYSCDLYIWEFFCIFGTPLKGPSEITSRRCGTFRLSFPKKNESSAFFFLVPSLPSLCEHKRERWR